MKQRRGTRRAFAMHLVCNCTSLNDRTLMYVIGDRRALWQHDPDVLVKCLEQMMLDGLEVTDGGGAHRNPAAELGWKPQADDPPRDIVVAPIPPLVVSVVGWRPSDVPVGVETVLLEQRCVDLGWEVMTVSEKVERQMSACR